MSGTKGPDPEVDRMTDEEASEYYYAHRSELELEGEPIEVEATRRLSRVISVRFDPDEARVVERRAREAGITMSAYVRQSALRRPAFAAPDPALLQTLVDLLTKAVGQAQEPAELLAVVATDVAHIREKIGA